MPREKIQWRGHSCKYFSSNYSEDVSFEFDEFRVDTHLCELR